MQKNTPAGLFAVIFSIMRAIPSFREGVDLSNDSQRLTITSNFTLIVSYITAAKGCLTNEIKNFIKKVQIPWMDGLTTEAGLDGLIEKGSNMSETEFDFYVEQECSLLGGKVKKYLLYWALCFSGIDGLNTEEIVRFLRVGRHMGVSEKILNNLLLMYFNECNLYKSFEDNIISDDINDHDSNYKLQSKM